VPTPLQVLRTIRRSEDWWVALGMVPLAVLAMSSFRLNHLRHWPSLVIGLFICSLPVIVGLAQLRSAWKKTWCMRVPAQTRITRAFDFGDDGGGFGGFYTTPRTYVIRDPRCAAAFERLNAARSAHFQSAEQKLGEKAHVLSANLWVFAMFLAIVSVILVIS